VFLREGTLFFPPPGCSTIFEWSKGGEFWAAGGERPIKKKNDDLTKGGALGLEGAYHVGKGGSFLWALRSGHLRNSRNDQKARPRCRVEKRKVDSIGKKIANLPSNNARDGINDHLERLQLSKATGSEFSYEARHKKAAG